MTIVKFNAVNSKESVMFNTMAECKNFIESHKDNHYMMKMLYIELCDNLYDISDPMNPRRAEFDEEKYNKIIEKARKRKLEEEKNGQV